MAKPTLGELLENGLFGAAGIVAEIQESFPRMVEKGRATLEPKLAMARFVGQFAVSRFGNEFQKKADSTLDQVTDLITLLFSQSRDGEEEHDGSDSTRVRETLESSPKSGSGFSRPTSRKDVEVDDLPISGYRTLSAQQIIARLDSLSQPELDQIEVYESRHRKRTSILRNIATKRAKN